MPHLLAAKAVLAVALVAFTPAAAHASAGTSIGQHGVDLDVQAANRESEKLWAAGKYQQALEMLEALLPRARTALGSKHPDLAEMLGNLGVLCLELRRYDEAERYSLEALVMRRRIFGPESVKTAESLNNLAAVYSTRGDFRKALSIYNESLALKRAKGDGDSPDVILTLGNIAVSQSMLGDYSEAERNYRHIIDAVRRTGPDTLDLAHHLSNLSELKQKTGEWDEAMRLLSEALEIRKARLPASHVVIATTELSLGGLLTNTGELNAARQAFDRGMAALTANAMNEHLYAVVGLSGLMRVSILEGALDAAQQDYEKARAICARACNPQEAIALAHNAAWLFIEAGDHIAAEKTLRATLDEFRSLQSPDPALWARTASSLAEVYGLLGNDAAASSYHRQSLQALVSQLGEEHPDVPTTIHNLGSTYVRMGDYVRGEPLLLKALAVRERALGKEHYLTLSSYNNLGTLSRLQGRLSEAMAWYEKVIALVEKDPRSVRIGLFSALVNAARILTMQREFAESERLLEIARKNQESRLHPNHPDLAITHRELASLSAARGQWRVAVEHARKAFGIEEASISANLPHIAESRRMLYVATLRDGVEQALALALATRGGEGHQEATRLAFKSVVHRQARVLDSIMVQYRSIHASDDARRRSWHRLSQLKNRYSELAFDKAEPTGPSELPARNRELTQLTAEIDRLEQVLADSASQPGDRQVDLEVQAAMKTCDQCAFVAIVRHRPPAWAASPGERYAMFQLSVAGEPTFFDLGPASTLNRAIERYRAALADPDTEAAYASGRELYSMLFGRSPDALAGIQRLFVLADGQITLIPFEALIDETGKFLIERFTISYLDNARELVSGSSSEAVRAGRASVVFADPEYGRAYGPEPAMVFARLPGTRVEATAMARAIEHVEVFLGEDASESALMAVTRPKILHIATHGITTSFDGEATRGPERGFRREKVDEGSSDRAVNPMLRSALILAGANRPPGRGDGIVSALDLSTMDLGATQLAVLSACDSGLGELVTHEGIVGLRRGLAVAGARGQIISLWRLHDRNTARLITNFYRLLAEAQPISESLRGAKLALLRSPRTSHPYFWAPLIFSGRDSRLVKRGDSDGTRRMRAPPGCNCSHDPIDRGPGPWLGVLLLFALRKRRRGVRRSVTR